MTMEYMEIGSSPYDELCAQLGFDNYRKDATKEMDAYINQLNRLFIEARNYGITFKQKWFNHDLAHMVKCVCIGIRKMRLLIHMFMKLNQIFQAIGMKKQRKS